MVTSEAPKPLTVPKEFLAPPGDFNPTLLIFLAAFTMLVLSNCGYWLWEWPHWCCFSTNDPENDPDHYVSTGGPLWLINARFLYHELFFFQRRLWRKHELWQWFVSRLIVGTIFYISIQYHFLGYILNFWFIPTAVVGLALGLFFDYLPHRPFKERDRWKNARVYPNSILNVLIMGQNYHLIHHLWPSIPWYNYQPAYYAMKPLLDEKGCHQSLGLLQGKDFFNFLYDVFLGIHFHKKKVATKEWRVASDK